MILGDGVRVDASDKQEKNTRRSKTVSQNELRKTVVRRNENYTNDMPQKSRGSPEAWNVLMKSGQRQRRSGRSWLGDIAVQAGDRPETSQCRLETNLIQRSTRWRQI